jgi:hypothetical protein
MRHISFYDIEQCKKDGMEEAEWARRPSSASMIKPPPYQAIDPQLVCTSCAYFIYLALTNSHTIYITLKLKRERTLCLTAVLLSGQKFEGGAFQKDRGCGCYHIL